MAFRHVLAFALLVAVGSSLVFGFVSFLQSLKVDLNALLKEGGTTSGRGTARSRFCKALVVGEVALYLMLLVGAGLLIESLYRLHQENLGFDPHNLVTMVTPFSGRYPTTARAPLRGRTFSSEEGQPDKLSSSAKGCGAFISAQMLQSFDRSFAVLVPWTRAAYPGVSWKAQQIPGHPKECPG